MSRVLSYLYYTGRQHGKKETLFGFPVVLFVSLAGRRSPNQKNKQKSKNNKSRAETLSGPAVIPLEGPRAAPRG